MGSCHIGHQRHPCLYPSGQCCIHRGSYHSHLEFLGGNYPIRTTIFNLETIIKIIWVNFETNHNQFTISIDVHSTGIALAVVVCVCLVWITIVRAVVTAVPNVIAVIIILPGIVHERTVVLFGKDKMSNWWQVFSCSAYLLLSEPVYLHGASRARWKGALFSGSLLMLGLVSDNAGAFALCLSFGMFGFG